MERLVKVYLRQIAIALPFILVMLAAEPRAAACGGCFHPPRENPTVVTDHRMIFAITPKQTTLYDQMRYTGAPSSFAWVLPIAGLVTIGLSSDELFNALDAETAVQIIAPERNCYVPQSCIRPFPLSAMAAAAPGSGGGGGVTVFAHEVVGPYETVQLRASDPKSLATWLSAHHYEIPPDAQAIIDGYVKEQSAFLAMKLVPGATVQAMRPVRVTSPGASVTLPLRMVAAGAGATLGVTLWVVSDGRYEPQNFPFFTIGAPDVVWDWTTSSSNYATVRAAKTKVADGAGWQIESSLDVPRQNIESQVSIASRPRVIAPPVPATAGREGGAPEKGAEEQRAEDLDVLFGGTSTHAQSVRVTRMRADLAHAALGRDLRVQASSDQGPLSNVVQVTREASPPSCPVYDEKCAIVGSAPRPEAEAKNKALASPQLARGADGKKWFSCAASPGSPSRSPHAVLVAISLVVAAVARRRTSRRSLLALLAATLLAACSKRDTSPSSSRSALEPAAAAPPAPEPASGPGASMGPVGDVDRVIATLRPKFKACYQTALNVDPNADGSVSLLTRISPDGRVVDVSTPDKTSMPPALVECLAGVVRGATFPAPGGTGSVLRVPVTFNHSSSPTR